MTQLPPTPAQPLTQLGHLSVEEFLRDYWQQKPVLIRQAFANFDNPISAEELAGLSLEEDIESRLILEHGLPPSKQPWQLLCGPFEDDIYTQLPTSHWTLLVQAVDQVVPEVADLLDHFRFLPSWRLDDVMVSYASDGGSVGPHFDYYDVFLLQGQGQRHWQIGQTASASDPRLANTDLSILQEFITQEEWTLNAGDMLYIPPQVAHWGTAVGEDCMTYSVGFRAPSQADILTDFAQHISAQLNEDQRYQDANLTRSKNPSLLDEQAIDRVQQCLQQLSQNRDTIAQWFGQHMTERKYPEQAIHPEEFVESHQWQQLLQCGQALVKHPSSRFAYRPPNQLFVDGENYLCQADLARILCQNQYIHHADVAPYLADQSHCDLLNQLINEGCFYFAEVSSSTR